MTHCDSEEAANASHDADVDLRDTLGVMEECVWTATLDEAGQWTYQAFAGPLEALTGRLPEYFHGGRDRWGSIVHPEDRSTWDLAAVKLRTESTGRCEYRIVRPDATVRWVRESVQALLVESGRARRYRGSVCDISDFKAAEAEACLLRRLALALAEAPDRTAALQVCLEQVCAATRWLLGEAWLPEADGQHLACSPAWHCGGRGWDIYRKHSEAIRFAPGQGVMGHVWTTRQPLWVRDLVRDSRFLRAGLAWEFGLMSAMAVPVIVDDEVIAVLGFFAADPRPEDTRLLDLASGVASLLGAFLRRRRAEEELLHERQLLHALMNSVPDGIYFKDAQSRFLRVNRAVAERFGLDDPDKAIGKTDSDFFSGESADAFLADEREVVRTGQPVLSKEEREVWTDGSVTWATTTTVPMRDVDGKIIGVLGISRDTTARHRDQERLEALIEENARLLVQARQSEERYRSLFEHAIEGIFQTTPDGRYITANPALAAMFGYESPDALMASVRDVTRQLYVDAARRDAFLRAMAEQGEVRDFQFEAYHRDGGILWISENARAVRDAHGGILFFEGTAQDITARKRSEEARRASEARYQALAENLAQSVFLKDCQGRFIAVNGPFCRGIGRAEVDILGRTDFDLFPRHLAEKYRGDDDFVLRTGQRLEQEEETLYGGETRTVRVVKTIARDGEGRAAGVIGSFSDVTEQKRLETQLRQAQKMDAVGQLAGGIAHDFNNLLTAILGNLGMTRSSLPADDANHVLLEAAERAGLRAAELTRQLLGFSRQALLQLGPVSLTQCVQEAADILRHTFDPRITLEVSCPGELWPAHVDANQILQVLLNLSLNARDAMPRGGRLRMHVENVVVTAEDAREQIEARPGEFLRLTVEDSGQGIEAAVMPRIYEPFFTTKAPGQGTGLGLAMVFGIVRQHQGWIRCHSEVGVGTRFDIYLPRHVPGDGRRHEPDRPAKPIGGSETVLLVDDEPLVREVAEKTLKTLGYRVVLAADGREALDLFQQKQREIDVVILDLTMPVLSGQETFELLRQIDPDVRVLFSSGYSAEQLAELARASGVSFMPKPYRALELARALRSLLDSREAKGT